MPSLQTFLRYGIDIFTRSQGLIVRPAGGKSIPDKGLSTLQCRMFCCLQRKNASQLIEDKKADQVAKVWQLYYASQRLTEYSVQSVP